MSALKPHDPQCIFCKIIAGQIPSPRVFENNEFIVIRDIQPQAKHHYLVIPRAHLPSLIEALPESTSAEASAYMGRMLTVGAQVARQQGLLPGGFRCVINSGELAGQTVFHLHLHVLGGQPLHGGFG